jgi:hypothetical protein
VKDNSTEIQSPSQIPTEEWKRDMRFHFEYDPDSKILLARFTGPVNDASIRNFYQIASSLVGSVDFRASIADFSEATSFHIPRHTIRELAELPPADPVASRPRIIVAPNVIVFALARFFQATGKMSRPNLHIVRNLNDALKLLSVSKSNFSPL